LGINSKWLSTHNNFVAKKIQQQFNLSHLTIDYDTVQVLSTDDALQEIPVEQ
jgi:hypothetical protein